MEQVHRLHSRRNLLFSKFASVALDNNELEGTVSESIGNLTKLKLLNVCNNKLVGVIPKVGDKLRDLRSCDFLPGNNFEGEVPTTASEMKEHRLEIASDARRSLLVSRPSAVGTSNRCKTPQQSSRKTREQRHNICKCYPILYIPSTKGLYQFTLQLPHERVNSRECNELYVKD